MWERRVRSRHTDVDMKMRTLKIGIWHVWGQIDIFYCVVKVR
jgi:hypothetical protein